VVAYLIYIRIECWAHVLLAQKTSYKVINIDIIYIWNGFKFKVFMKPNYEKIIWICELIPKNENHPKFNKFCFISPKIVEWQTSTLLHPRLSNCTKCAEGLTIWECYNLVESKQTNTYLDMCITFFHSTPLAL